jgi:hypothetical protein
MSELLKFYDQVVPSYDTTLPVPLITSITLTFISHAKIHWDPTLSTRYFYVEITNYDTNSDSLCNRR